jgi:hydrogenase maturation protein HypF
VLAADLHPEYRSSKLARSRASEEALPLIEVQHHHAHVAACLADNDRPLAAPPVLGIVLDGMGWGADGGIWGGEFLLADYREARRLGTFKPVALLGGDRAAREPWRNLYAHLVAAIGWPEFATQFAGLEIHDYFAAKPRGVLDAMLSRGLNAPPASSCGRLFDAVAAALGICRERQRYEGEAAAALEAIADERTLLADDEELAYPFTVSALAESGLPCLDAMTMWRALLADRMAGTPPAVIAARFHKGLARAIAAMVDKLALDDGGAASRFDTVALSGGCFQNELLFSQTVQRLEARGYAVLSHVRIPCNDGGLAFGQAAVAAARWLSAPAER